MVDSMHVGIAGAGLLGRLLAWRLAAAGHRVSVFDAALGPEPVPRSQAPEPYMPTAAGFTAAGMLSPLAELDNAEPAVAALGWRSLDLWRAITAALPNSAPFTAGLPPGESGPLGGQRTSRSEGAWGPWFTSRGSLLVAHRADLGAAQRVLDRLQAATATPEWRAASPAEGVQPLDAAALRALEPAVQGPSHAWLLPGEGQIDTVATLRALHAAAEGAAWHWGVRVLDVQGGAHGGTLHLADGRVLAFDAVVDVRGVGARPALPVRGVRGEVVWLHCPGHGLTRPVRLLHPRHRVYVVPRSAQDVLVGASEIESEDRSPVSLRSATELMAAAHSVVPALAEARILKLDVNLRPALPDNAPRTEHGERLLRINGLFRHGWLLAPALVDAALRHNGWAEGGLASESIAACGLQERAAA